MGKPGPPHSPRALSGVLPALGLAWRAAPAWTSGHLALTVVAGLTPVATVWLLKSVLDELTTAGGHGVPASAYALALAGVVTGATPAAMSFVHNEIVRAVGRRAQAQLYLATARFAGLGRLEDPAFRDRLRLAQQSGRTGPGSVFDGVIALLQGLITLGGLVLVLASISPVMAGVAMLGAAPALIAQIHLSRARSRMMWSITPAERREFFYADLLTSLPAAKEVRLLGLFDLFRNRMLGELRAADGQRRRVDARDLRVQIGLAVLAAAVAGGGLLWAVRAAGDGRLTIGDVSAFIAAVAGLQAALATLVTRVATVYQALLLYDHYRAVLRAEPDLPIAANARPAPALRHGIELRDVWFRYAPDQPWVLRGVNLVIPRGSAVALVGLNGAGKSTLVKLLCRFYDPDRGAILWDGEDLRSLSVESLRERIGAVFQDYMTYDLPASENVGLGEVTALDDLGRIRSAARMAGIDQTLQGLPRGYRTMLSRMYAAPAGAADPETGVLLSGGQWQRVALARALMRDRRDLMILDEPSSGLDAAAEYEIHHRLRRHRAGATSVLISHRLGAVRDADRIVVLSGGAIAEQGTHTELMASGGEYARLFRLQADGYRDDPDRPRLLALVD
jgi:ATP-binding cassette, subfamily B, bacterial